MAVELDRSDDEVGGPGDGDVSDGIARKEEISDGGDDLE